MHVVSVVFCIYRTQNVSLIGRVARYTPSSTFYLRLDILQNLFDKPNEQSQACLDSAMARKGGRWTQYAST